MITITKLNDTQIIINSDLIETMEQTPDTTITLTTGKKIIAKESIEDIVIKIKLYKREIYSFNTEG